MAKKKYRVRLENEYGFYKYIYLDELQQRLTIPLPNRSENLTFAIVTHGPNYAMYVQEPSIRSGNDYSVTSSSRISTSYQPIAYHPSSATQAFGGPPVGYHGIDTV